MKAIVYEEYGPPEVLQFTEVEKPAPKDNEVLLKVQAASINYIDWQVLTGESFFLRLTTGGIRKPKNKILGDDIAGRVEAVGKYVKQFQPGDEVFGISNFDAFAEYACVPENALVFAKGDRAIFTLWYFHFALKERPDLAIIATDLLHFDWYQETLQSTYPSLTLLEPYPWPATIEAANPARPVCSVEYTDVAEVECTE